MTHQIRALVIASLAMPIVGACIPGPYPVDIFQEMHYTATQRREEPNRAAPPVDSVPVTGREPRMSFSEAAQLVNPVSDAAASTGEQLVRTNCEICHGQAGNGQPAPLMAPYFQNNPAAPVAPPPFDSARVRSRTDGQLYWIIRNGLGNMPAFGQELNADEMWAIVTYIRGRAGS
jgi:mono/diheme cytochrome c family protein